MPVPLPFRIALELGLAGIRSAADQPSQTAALRFDAAGAAAGSPRLGRNLPRCLVTLQPAYRARYARRKALGGRIARQPARNGRLDHVRAKIIGQRLLVAAGIVRPLRESPGRFIRLGSRSKLHISART